MIARFVDAEVVKRIKARAIRDLHQNCYENRQRGRLAKELLTELDLWEINDEVFYFSTNTLDHSDTADTVCGSQERSGCGLDGETVS